ncbi:PKD domain-containing protein [Flagellimonas meridianipacifica]|uniref:Gliding motility-associated-like protein n=1 Tax=Flagellimonas meridianipacifica TaxID=1080225 RepID=A0A2T0MI26_9FLAO|nr:PKD domain-containing protein [Allomuricauda pacifica]PRX57222.1 gliding motility-associated-like protein [Allomuricauda pacifica]
MMSNKNKVLLGLCLILCTVVGHSQTDNMDFEFGNFDNWTLDIGVRTTPNNVDWNGAQTNELNTQIRIMNPSVPPIDEYGLLCSPSLNIPTVFPMGAFSARIGDNPGGRRAARISRTFTVTPDESYLQYSYAVILEEPGHTQESQPKFVVNIRDDNGNIVNCGQFEAFAGPNAASQGFVGCNYDRAYRCDFPISDCSDSNALPGFNFPVQILPWTSGGADLTPFIGQQITIEFIALDCMLGGHGGTAYVEATVEPLEIQVEGLCSMGPNNITLTAPIGFSAYEWSTGETTRSITVNGAQFGDTFSVDLTSNTGCDTSASITLGPVAAATIDPIPNQEICEGGSAVISPTGTNVGDFSFPDIGVTGNSAVVSPTTTTTYTVIARDENGCDGESTTVTIDVIPSTEPPFPNADFTLEPIITQQSNPCNTVQLNNLSGYCKSDLTYLWDFGDGSPTSTEQNPQHTFPTTNTPTTYYVTLTVTSASDGLSDTMTLPFTTSTILPNFYLLEDCGTVTVTNISTICGATFDNYPTFSYSWDFGDGTPVVTTDSDTAEFTHTYTASGNYTIEVTMTDSNSGLELTAERPVRVTVGLQADFQFYPDCYDVQFIDLSTTCDPIQTYLWDFGDGNTSNEMSPLHTYATVGPHTVTLTVNDGTNILSYMETVLLDPDNPAAEFDFNVVCDVVTFTDFSNSCVPLTYQWDFGDGSAIDTTEDPIHIFEYGNTYDVTLTINDGTQDYSITKQISVLSAFDYQDPQDMQACSDVGNPDSGAFDFAPQSDYILANVAASGPFAPVVTFHGTLNDAENNANLLFNDFSNTVNPQIIYARVEDSQGCFQTFPFSLRVDVSPVVNALDDVELCYLRENSIGYDLSQLNARAFEGLDQSNIELTYHLDEQEALDDLNSILNIDLIAGTDTQVFVRAENRVAPECFTVSSVNLRMDNENTDVEDRCMPFFSNTMTPNGDGANDVFYIENIETFPNNQLTIYNRWGHVVFERAGYSNDWEGTYKGKPLPVGTYYYYIRLNDPDNRSHSGYVTILR